VVQIEQLLACYYCFLLTETPTVKLLGGRPNPPAVDSDEYKRWSETLTIAYDGGYIEATYGNLIQTFDFFTIDGACADRPVAVVRKQHSRVNRIGDPAINIAEARFTYNKYPKRNSSNAAGGAAYTIHTDIGSYTARIGGDVQTFMAWACERKNEFYSATSIQTGSGAWYGPISSATPTE
jgi:hypothetical protein